MFSGLAIRRCGESVSVNLWGWKPGHMVEEKVGKQTVNIVQEAKRKEVKRYTS